MRRQKFHPDQSSLFGYISPVTGDIAVHPPLCACGKCPMPVESLEPPKESVETALLALDSNN